MCFSTIELNGELSWTGPGSRSWRWQAVCRGSFSLFREMLTDVSCIAFRFLCFTQCSSLFLCVVLGYSRLHPAMHPSLCTLAMWVWLVQAAGWSLHNPTGNNAISTLPSPAQSNQLVTQPQAELSGKHLSLVADNTERLVNNRKERDRVVYF